MHPPRLSFLNFKTLKTEKQQFVKLEFSVDKKVKELFIIFQKVVCVVADLYVQSVHCALMDDDGGLGGCLRVQLNEMSRDDVLEK